jgi:hypothetical protein
MLQLNSAMEAIESERADEASGTGNLGSVTFTQRTPGTAVPSPTAAPPRPIQSSHPHPQSTSNGTATPAVGAPTARVELSGPVAAPVTPPASTPESPPDPAPVVPQPVASAPPAAPRLPDPAYVSSQPEPMFTPPAPAPEPEPEPEARPVVPDAKVDPHPYTLGVGDAFTTDYDDDDYDDDPAPASRRSGGRSGARSRLPMLIVGIVIIAALAVIAGYFVYGRTTGSGEQTFAKTGAPFTFRYPKDFHERRLDGGVALNKPTYQVGFGLDANNYLLASTYKLGFTVQADGSATGPKGQQLTPDQINHDIDVTIAKLAGQAGFTQQGVESGSLGPLRARIYNYAKSDGSLSSTFVVALAGKTEYYVTCQSSPRGEKVIAKACQRVLTSFART